MSQFLLLLTRRQMQKRDVIGRRHHLRLDIMYALPRRAHRGHADDQRACRTTRVSLFHRPPRVLERVALHQPLRREKFIVIPQASGATVPRRLPSKLVIELPKLSSKIVFCTAVYWIVGFNPDPVRFALFVVIVRARCSSSGWSWRQVCPSAHSRARSMYTIFTLFGGIYLNMDSIPQGAGDSSDVVSF